MIWVITFNSPSVRSLTLSFLCFAPLIVCFPSQAIMVKYPQEQAA
ncbi:hypothetical protein [Anabaena sp. 4-3]|nr:hypothetical protein [Anabaena sp. 4-3]